MPMAYTCVWHITDQSQHKGWVTGPGQPRPIPHTEHPMTSATEDIDELQASMLRSLASPNRLRILHLLGIAAAR